MVPTKAAVAARTGWRVPEGDTCMDWLLTMFVPLHQGQLWEELSPVDKHQSNF
ncbi:hypothetical protein CNECB9_5360058 [Cupriavidus necator]|uniref:Uncharacterized protein n=1 Tax=Cupriavidus necator TaxID=106590 RepID=A0A1K0JXE3_CUPNE|nr:hypothetical protein CNECB9_5360058 [Cupriavidus necator]